jgi:hypothetical protein
MSADPSQQNQHMNFALSNLQFRTMEMRWELLQMKKTGNTLPTEGSVADHDVSAVEVGRNNKDPGGVEGESYTPHPMPFE